MLNFTILFILLLLIQSPGIGVIINHVKYIVSAKQENEQSDKWKLGLIIVCFQDRIMRTKLRQGLYE